MDRRWHFVGTLPQFADAEEAVRWHRGELAGQVRRIGGGETGKRLQWFVSVVEELKHSGAVRVVKDGDWTAYDDIDHLAARRLEPERIPLHIADDVLAEFELLPASGTPATAQQPLQVGVPAYLDMTLFLFGPLGVAKHARAFRRRGRAHLACARRGGRPGGVPAGAAAHRAAAPPASGTRRRGRRNRAPAAGRTGRRTVRDHVETALGRPVDLAPSCGPGGARPRR
ncbi:hypothetical protein AB0F91_08910 [Amycolatopsis sp. NPDC023774]|uniref:hypothetical protein n=1 Tax=Amycolatopsis sp. NPDC023774 TaxID=3155015 RepID=UPI0033DBD539